jgi:hypothetical protein
MIPRLILLVPLTLLTLLFSFLELTYGKGIPWFFGICTLVGTYVIARIVINHRRFKLVGDILIFKSFLRRARSIDLSIMTKWRELGFNIRGQRRKTIILLFDKDEKVIVDNSEYEKEFDELLIYLAQNYVEQQQE